MGTRHGAEEQPANKPREPWATIGSYLTTIKSSQVLRQRPSPSSISTMVGFLQSTMTLASLAAPSWWLLLINSASGVHGADQQEACSDLNVLGTPNWDRYDGALEIEVDDECVFTWTATFKHDENLPVPDDPANQCDPAVMPPVLAADGLPYYAFRWSYIKTSESFKAATGVDHVSLDFNPCGHPPVGIFTGKSGES